MQATLKFKVDLFGANVTTIFTDEDDVGLSKLLKKLYKLHGESHLEDIGAFDGACFCPDDDIYQYYVIFRIQALSHRLIAHENEHLKNYILEKFGCTIKSGDEELPPSLAELIAGKTYNFIEKKKLKLH